MADLIQPTPSAAPEATSDEADTESEFHNLFSDAKDGQDRFETLAKSAEAAGNVEIAKVYREMSATVLGLIADMAMSAGGALIAVEDAIDSMPDGDGPKESGLLREDADKYLALFDQYLRLLDGLGSIVPEGSEGDAQREVFATLRRLTVGMREYTTSIVLDDDDEDDDDDATEDDEDDDA